MSNKKLRILITPPIQRAAELRGIPVNLWLQAVILQRAHQDIVEARTILERAGFADAGYRERRQEAWRNRPPAPDVPTHDWHGVELPPLKSKIKKSKPKMALREKILRNRHSTDTGYDLAVVNSVPLPEEKMARIKIVPAYDESDPVQASRHVDHTRFYGPDNKCGYEYCDHCNPLPVDDPA